LRDKVSVEIKHLEQIQTFSGPDRDPRGWSISALYFALLPYDRVNALVRQKVEALEWADAMKPGHRMAFDHSMQLAFALATLRDRVAHPALPLHLMPEKFTLTALQQACEVILGRKLDKAAFRRRAGGSPDLVELPGEKFHGAHTPAQLYRARDGFKFIV
jgi:8-oxo-dGTP diphosphatase